MQSLKRLLPSASALVVFEAAGRHENFSRAAEELAMTQAAVSYAIRALETQIGVPLFHRSHRAVALTETGARFHADVSAGLARIQKSAEQIRAKGREANVTLSASTAFASMWMLPRIPRLRQDLPDIDLRIQTSERDIDLMAENIPLGIRSAPPGAFPEYASHVLAWERIEAVIGPAYVDRFGMPQSDEEIVRHRLIHLEEPYRPCPDWGEWLRAIGLARPPLASGLLINDYVLVVQAVMQGQGIALGWKHLTDPLVEAGLLLRASGHVLETDSAFQILWPRDRPLPAAAAQVRDWLIANAEAA